MTKEVPKDYGPNFTDVQGRPLKVVDAGCGCCYESVRVNIWSLFGHGNVRCATCRKANCSIAGVKPKRRCGRPDPGFKILYGSRA